MPEIFCPLINQVCDNSYCNKVGKESCIKDADLLAEFALKLATNDIGVDTLKDIVLKNAKIFKKTLDLDAQKYELFLERVRQTMQIGRIDVSNLNKKDEL